MTRTSAHRLIRGLSGLWLALASPPASVLAAPERPPGVAPQADETASSTADVPLEKRRRTAALERAEPTVDEVRDAALRASGLQSRRDRAWAARARMSAVLPQVTLRVSRDVARDKGRSRSSTGTERLDIDVNRDSLLEARAVWNLDRLVFDSVELSAARAALSESRERANLAAQVVALYYERRRAQLALIWQPPTTDAGRLESELAIREFTAALDALTDGEFSKLVRSRQQLGLLNESG